MISDAIESPKPTLDFESDIIRSHGGSITLDKSKMNGLSVKIFLPV